MQIPFSRFALTNASSDSQPFKEKKIPAITISAMGQEWEKVLHSRNDQVEKVNGTSVYPGYRLALALVNELDGLPCEVSREESRKQ
jgi:hypothetical protein